MYQGIVQFFNNYVAGLYLPEVRVIDIIEIVIVAFLVYKIMVWIKNTKAWMLLRGIIVLGLFILIAAILRMHTVMWLARNSITVLATAGIVVFQPELRRALEKLGEQNFLSSVALFDKSKERERFSEHTVHGIINAVFEMSKVKTGALIVVEQAIHLTEYESTGIELDSLLSSQLLINIFEHNTPLHDGAIIVRGDRIVSATCYLPLSDNMGLSKDLGTRHRAAVGVSEVSDALVIVVSEETGHVSIALGGQLVRNVTPEYLRERLGYIRKKASEPKRASLWKGRRKHEKKTDK